MDSLRQKLEIMNVNSLTNLRRGYSLLSYNPRGNLHVQAGDRWLVKTENQRTKEKHQYPQYYLKQVPSLFNFSPFDQFP